VSGSTKYAVDVRRKKGQISGIWQLMAIAPMSLGISWELSQYLLHTLPLPLNYIRSANFALGLRRSAVMEDWHRRCSFKAGAWGFAGQACVKSIQTTRNSLI
jgi:hypothetical protein